jgi:hypothetical protein
MLKTFVIKQMDIVRRDAYLEMKKGNVARGLKNLTKFAVVLGVSGMSISAVKDWMLGRPVDFSTPAVLLNILKTFGFSEFAMEKVKSGRPSEALGGIIAPPYKLLDELVRDDSAKARYLLPVVGPLVDAHLLGGKDKHLAKAPKGATLTPEQEAARERLREKKKAKRLAKEEGR